MAKEDKEQIEGFIVSLNNMAAWLRERRAMSDIPAIIQQGLFMAMLGSCEYLIDNFRALQRRLL